MIRKKVYFFLAAFGCSLLLLPLYNFIKQPALLKDPKVALAQAYNIDELLPLVTTPLYELTISVAPKQVILGKEGWFYLGDQYVDTFTRKRQLLATDKQAIDTVIANSLLWEAWFKQQGVKAYQIMLAPDKANVYSEYLPHWASMQAPSALDYFEQQSQNTPYIHLRHALIAAKAHYPYWLYHRTDTHWNRLGAWLGFNAFAQQMQTLAPELRWPQKEQVEQGMGIDPENSLAGDLASFQHVEKSELGYFIKFADLEKNPIIAKKVDLDTGEVINTGVQTYEAPQLNPVIYRNSQALNQARVLWIHDSFGTNMAPWMLRSFSEVIQIYTGGATAARVEQLTLDYKPDYVFSTVIERDTLFNFYLSVPP